MSVTTFAELFGAVFPAEPDVRQGVEYGPLGDDLTGTLQVAPPDQGDHAIVRTFMLADSSTVPGVRMSVVGVAGKTRKTKADGVAQINIDDGTYTVRVTPPPGFEGVDDFDVTIDGGDSAGTIVLVPLVVVPPEYPPGSSGL